MIASYTQVCDNMIALNGFYDLCWSGICVINDRFYSFKTIDLTDYNGMNDRCPSCSIDSEDYTKCNCENYVEVFCVLTPIGYASNRCRLQATRKTILKGYR